MHWLVQPLRRRPRREVIRTIHRRNGRRALVLPVFASLLCLVGMLGVVVLNQGMAAASTISSPWSIVPTPTSESGLTNVSCTSSTSCMAIGLSESEEWNGTSWSVVPLSIPTSFSFGVSSVSCTGVPINSCELVGEYQTDNGSPSMTLIESWNGSTWSIIPSPNTGFSDGLSGVSCASPSFCVAVGNDGWVPIDDPLAMLVSAVVG